MLTLSKLDHLVLTVRDIDRTVAFYESVMGMQKEVFSQGRIALKYGAQKINLHQLDDEFEPRAETPTPGSADLCFLTETPLYEAMEYVRTCHIDIIEGPVDRTGACGQLRSFYFRDPDQNLIEVANEC